MFCGYLCMPHIYRSPFLIKTGPVNLAIKRLHRGRSILLFHPNCQINHRAPVIHCCQCRFKPILPIHPFLSTATLFISKDQWRWLQRYTSESHHISFGMEMFINDWLGLVGSRWYAFVIKGRRYHVRMVVRGVQCISMGWLNSVWRLVRACPLFWVGGMLSIGNLLRFGHKWSHGTDVG